MYAKDHLDIADACRLPGGVLMYALARSYTEGHTEGERTAILRRVRRDLNKSRA